MSLHDSLPFYRGLICEVQERETQSSCEQVPLDDPELLAYLSGPSDDGRGGAEIRAELEASDLEFVRVIEDVITVLIDKRVFMLTDLPAAAQQQLARRYHLRSTLAALSGIVSDSEDTLLP